MIRLTAKAALTNFHAGYYIVLIPLGLATIGGVLLHNNLLMSCGVIAAETFGLFAGTTLAEIKVKPLSYALPGQERSMAPAMLLVGAAVCATYAILVLLRPMSIVDVPAPQQSLSVFGFSFGVFMLVAGVCVRTRDTAYLPLFVVIPLTLLLVGMGDEAVSAPWLAMNAAIAERPLSSVLFAALGVGLVFAVLGSRKLSRDLCGAPFMPFKAYDNPFKLEDYRTRMRNTAFRPSIMTDSRSPPGGALFAALSRRLAGTSWDYLALETRIARNRWELAFRLVNLLAFFVWFMAPFPWRSGNAPSPLIALLILVAVTFGFFAPTFKPRLSPMLPVGRRQHFTSFIAKGILVYVFAILALALLDLVAGRLPDLGLSVSGGFVGIAELPFKGVLMVATAIPILCWAYTKLRSVLGLVVFMILFVTIFANVVGRAYAPLMRLGYPAVLLASAVCWLPFVYIAWKRCYRDDLLLP